MINSISILDVKTGDALRIAMKTRKHLIADPANPSTLVLQQNPNHAPGYAFTAFYAYTLNNNPQLGIITVDVQDEVTLKHYTSDIAYGDIANAMLYRTDIRDYQESAPAIFPGYKALGSKVFPLPGYIPIIF